MSTLVLGREPVIEEWLERRRALGQDKRDEVWEGVYHVAPPVLAQSGVVAGQLATQLYEPARAAGLVPTLSFNLGSSDDLRVPDLGCHRPPVDYQLYMPTAALVVEVPYPEAETFREQ